MVGKHLSSIASEVAWEPSKRSIRNPSAKREPKIRRATERSPSRPSAHSAVEASTVEASTVVDVPDTTKVPPAGEQRQAYDDRVKRGFDVIVSVLLLIAFAPGIIAIAAAVKLGSPGPVLFRQKRYGQNNEQFEVFKFRTMFIDKTDHSGVRQTRENDPRITPLGRVLRRCSLDELPQLINVVRGDMSLVGPRPHVPGMLAAGMLYEELVPDYFERHRVRPGITGLAQVSGLRGSTEDAGAARARIDYDLAYIEHRTLGLDLLILWRTLRREFLSGNGI